MSTKTSKIKGYNNQNPKRSNSDKALVEKTLTDLANNKVIKHYQEINSNNPTANPIINMSYSCVIASVEKEIEDKDSA